MMKKFGKFFLIMAVALVALFAMMTVASAATIDSVTADVAGNDAREISVTVAYGSPEAAQQSTILVVPQGTDIATLQDSAIKYIDQEAVDEKTVTYTFKLLADDRTGAYDVYVGGTAVEAPGSTNFSFDAKKIIGTITVLDPKALSTATAVAKAANGTETAGVVAADGKYTITVGQGTYDVVLGRTGYLYKTYKAVAVNEAEHDLGAITLVAGDVVGDGVINLEDLSTVLLDYKTNNASLDLDNSGEVNLVDLNAVLDNYKLKAETAYEK